MLHVRLQLKSINLAIILLLLLLISSCKSNQKKKSEDVKLEDLVSADDIFNDIDRAKKIFYSLPSPLETAVLIKSAGAEYDDQLLNPISNVQKYTTNKSMALNLGIYTTDLSFASLFDQAQASINYMNAARSMAKGLDITDAIDDKIMQRLKDNLNNKDVVMDIISETFLNSSSYLKENDREEVAAIVLVGGWIEGLYIATQLIDDKPIKNNKLADRTLEQKLSFNIVQRMLEDNRLNAKRQENEDIVSLIAQLQDLKKAFDKVKIESTQIEVEPNNETNVTTLKSQNKITVTPEAFKELQETVKKLRTEFIQ
jgi:hypothetical protein